MPPTVPTIRAGQDLLLLARGATEAVEALLSDATAKVRALVTVDDRVVGRLFDRE